MAHAPEVASGLSPPPAVPPEPDVTAAPPVPEAPSGRDLTEHPTETLKVADANAARKTSEARTLSKWHLPASNRA